MGILVQVIATVLLCFSCVNLGINTAWPSSTVLLFKSENTTLHRPMSEIEIAVFSSISLFAAFVIQPVILVGVLGKLGLKRTTMLTSILYVIGWSLVAVTNRVEAVLTSVVITGCGNAIFILISMYISEIAQDSIRGTLTSGPNLSCSIGLLVSYFLGGILEYHVMVYCCLSMAVINVFMIAILKQSPLELLAKGREEEAAKSIAFYRQTSSTSKEVLTEMNNIRRSLNIELKDARPLVEAAEPGKPTIQTKRASCWQLFKTTPSMRRQLYLAMILQSAFVYQGLPSIEVYAEPVFTATVGDVISPNLSSVLFGVIVIVAGVIAAYLTDKIGRRPLQIYASVVCGVCCLFVGTQIVTEWLPKWTVLLFIYVFATSHTVGSGTVPFVVAAEIFLPEVKNKLLMVTFEWGYLSWCICMFLFSIVMQSLGLATVFYFFATVCMTTAVFFYYCLPETKGLPVYAIQALFIKEGDKNNHS